MKLNLKADYKHILVAGALIATCGYLAFEGYSARQLFPTGELPYEAKRKVNFAFLLFFLTFSVAVFWLVYRKIERLQSTQNWLIDAVNWNIERLKAHGLCRLPENRESTKESENEFRWPWGSHHTEYLGHLEAAARKWWNLYDPSDPTTAPTNEIVSDWLHSERKISREKARAIASMLRPDGLPTGPRR